MDKFGLYFLSFLIILFGIVYINYGFYIPKKDDRNIGWTGTRANPIFIIYKDPHPKKGSLQWVIMGIVILLLGLTLLIYAIFFY